MGVKIDKVIEIYVPDETIQQRLSGRRVCLDCGATYHTAFKPSKCAMFAESRSLSVRTTSQQQLSADFRHITNQPLLLKITTVSRASSLLLRDRIR